MAPIHVHYVGYLAQLVGAESDEVQLPPRATARDLLAVLAARRGPDLLAVLLSRRGDLREGSCVFIDNRSIGELQGLETILDDAAEVNVVVGMFPIGGG